MKIAMYLEKALIDSIRINKEKISEPGYISSFIRELKERHEPALLQSDKEAEFLLLPFNASGFQYGTDAAQAELF